MTFKDFMLKCRDLLDDGSENPWHTKFKPLLTGQRATFERITVLILGLAVLQPLFFVVGASPFVVRRFGLPPECIGPFLGILYSFQNTMCLVGWLVSFGIGKLAEADFAKKYSVYINGTYSMVLIAVLCFLNIRSLVLFGTGIGDRNITKYYWNVGISGMIFGSFDGTVRSISYMNNDIFGMGISFTGFVINILHFVVGKLLPKDCELAYWAVYWQMILAILLTLVGGIMWTIVVIFDRFGPPKPVYGHHASSNPSFKEAAQKAIPFATMLWLGWGCIFFNYPAIAPFSIMPITSTQTVLRTIMYLQAVVGSLMYPLNNYFKMGMEWSRANGNIYYYGIMLLFIPYLSIGTTFIFILHYPKSFLGKMIYMRPMVAGPLTVIYFFSGLLMMSVSWAGVYSNMSGSSGTDGSARGMVMKILGIGLMTTLVCMKLCSEGYVATHRAAKAAVESGLPYPTEGMNTFAAFMYWFRKSITGGCKMFVSLFTRDVRQRVMFG